MEPALKYFTHIFGRVALEHGVTDGERSVLNVDGAAVLMKELYAMSHRRT